MTTGIVVFDPAAFKARYPEFATATDAQLQGCFDEACLIVDNTACSVVRQVERRTTLLWMLTAHIAALTIGVNGQAPSGLVGRVDSATEGSVSVHADWSGASASQAWYLQTPYGAMFWQVTSIYRRFRYIPGRSGPAPTASVGSFFRWGFGNGGYPYGR